MQLIINYVHLIFVFGDSTDSALRKSTVISFAVNRNPFSLFTLDILPQFIFPEAFSICESSCQMAKIFLATKKEQKNFD